MLSVCICSHVEGPRTDSIEIPGELEYLISNLFEEIIIPRIILYSNVTWDRVYSATNVFIPPPLIFIFYINIPQFFDSFL